MLRFMTLPALALLAACSQQTVAASDTASPDEPREILRRAVELRTATGRGKTPELASYLADQFRKGGFPDDDVHVLSFDDPDDPKAALIVRYPGDGLSNEEPILLLAHMDVVDAVAEAWERDPFTLIEENGYLFGRGVLDNKLGVTALTSVFLRLKAEGFVPSRDLVIGFTADEETGMATTQALVGEHRGLTDAAYALNSDAGGGTLSREGEPIVMMVQAAEKTYATFELTANNPGGHSSVPRADNAIYDLAAALNRLAVHRFPVRSNDLTLAFFKETAKATEGPVGEAMAAFAADPTNIAAADSLFNIPDLVGMTRTTCVATMLRGGHAENALARSATATVNCRIFPGVEVATVREMIRDVIGNDTIEITTLDQPASSPDSPLTQEIMQAVSDAIQPVAPGVRIVPMMAPYGTDGKWVRRAGIPTYGVSGLMIKSEDMFAHGLNERIPAQAVDQSVDYWERLLKDLAG